MDYLSDSVQDMQQQSLKLYRIAKNNWIYLIIGVTVFLSIVLYFIIRYYRSVMRKIYCSRCYTTFKNIVVPIHGRSSIPYNMLYNSESNSVTYLLFMYISNWYYNTNNWKHVFHKGANIDLSCLNSIAWNQIHAQSPGVWLNPMTNDLRVVVQTQTVMGLNGCMTNNTGSNTIAQNSTATSSCLSTDGKYLEYVDISNIPIGKFFQLGIVIEDKKVEIYMNGFLIKTKLLNGNPLFQASNIYFGLGGSFSGYLSYFHYIPQKLSHEEIKLSYETEKYFVTKYKMLDL